MYRMWYLEHFVIINNGDSLVASPSFHSSLVTASKYTSYISNLRTQLLLYAHPPGCALCQLGNVKFYRWSPWPLQYPCDASKHILRYLHTPGCGMELEVANKVCFVAGHKDPVSYIYYYAMVHIPFMYNIKEVL